MTGRLESALGQGVTLHGLMAVEEILRCSERTVSPPAPQ